MAEAEAVSIAADSAAGSYWLAYASVVYSIAFAAERLPVIVAVAAD